MQHFCCPSAFLFHDNGVPAPLSLQDFENSRVKSFDNATLSTLPMHITFSITLEGLQNNNGGLLSCVLCFWLITLLKFLHQNVDVLCTIRLMVMRAFTIVIWFVCAHASVAEHTYIYVPALPAWHPFCCVPSCSCKCKKCQGKIFLFLVAPVFKVPFKHGLIFKQLAESIPLILFIEIIRGTMWLSVSRRAKLITVPPGCSFMIALITFQLNLWQDGLLHFLK